MKIVSLLPSATEIVYALGLHEQLVGVSCDCDYPDGASSKPVVSRSALRKIGNGTPASIDAGVRESLAAFESLYTLDRDLVRELQPDLILAQDLCRVCAVPSGHVTEALASIGCEATVLSLDPHTFSEVIDDIERVAAVTDATSVGEDLVRGLKDRIEAVSSATAPLEPIGTLALEWADPPFTGGHWIPEMVRLAGGREVLGVEGAPSRACTWDEITSADPEVVVFMPCGFGLDEAMQQVPRLFDTPDFAALSAVRNGRLVAVDGSSFFSRPGPRLVDGLEILAWATHPEIFPAPPPGRGQRVPLDGPGA
jgi:iron complex transport system substrate-binding protein